MSHRYHRLTQPLIRERRGPSGPPPGDLGRGARPRRRRASRDVSRDHGPSAFGLFSCSKATNEMNYVAQKFARVAIGSNNIDSCNRT